MVSFSIIPVLDLKGGSVVHARGGDRARYAPIRSRLSTGGDILAMAEALLSFTQSRALYIADLDAIDGRGSHRDIIADLAGRWPGIALWVDQGMAAPAAALALARSGVVPVLGSESVDDPAIAGELLAELGPERFVLSLDYRGERFLGPPALESESGLWPNSVIVMNLSRVGMDAGPDFARLERTRQRAATRSVFAAGGLRDLADIDRLAAAGISGALVATALHEGRLSRDALAILAGER